MIQIIQQINYITTNNHNKTSSEKRMLHNQIESFFHATQYPLKKSKASIIRMTMSRFITRNLMSKFSLLNIKAKIKKEGKITITYLGRDEKLPWIVGVKKTIRA